MSFAFKKFNFLQHTEVPVHAYPINGTCCAPSPHHLYVGCDNGLVVVLDPSFQQLCSFQAHSFRVFHVAYLEVRTPSRPPSRCPTPAAARIRQSSPTATPIHASTDSCSPVDRALRPA